MKQSSRSNLNCFSKELMALQLVADVWIWPYKCWREVNVFDELLSTCFSYDNKKQLCLTKLWRTLFLNNLIALALSYNKPLISAYDIVHLCRFRKAIHISFYPFVYVIIFKCYLIGKGQEHPSADSLPNCVRKPGTRNSILNSHMGHRNEITWTITFCLPAGTLPQS